MILYFNYEELEALRAGARALLGVAGSAPTASVIAPAESRARVEELVPRLQGDMSLDTLAEVRSVQLAVTAIVECLRAEMESMVAATHAADEAAVAAYFDFAHGFAVASRLREMASEMEDLIELVTGEPPSNETARTFKFDD